MKIYMTHEIQIAPNTFLRTKVKRRIPLCGIEFDEDFLSELVSKHMRDFRKHDRPTLSTAFEIYMRENTSSHRRKFQTNANQYFNTFTKLFGDLHLDELRHWRITQYRDHLLAKGLHPNSVRKHNNILDTAGASNRLDILETTEINQEFPDLDTPGASRVVRPSRI